MPQMEELPGRVPARPECITPSIRFLHSPRSFGLDFLQTPPHGDALALLLAFGSALAIGLSPTK